ncbi:hypothetical protein [uncultured Nonlabens sp.]|uniref:hypothetical protein n=1 Tax=uncultured Nonlabens sp. TaxID=859306 RepID=UPI002619F5B1|nr:hypothetical protein [uncultured Nonlabens sp.]
MNLIDYNGYQNTRYKIVKFRKVPYHLEMNLNEFMELSNMEHGINLRHDTSAFYFINEKKCDKTQAAVGIGSTPNYENIGGGHMTIRGEFDPKTTGPIKSLGISLE